MNRKWKGKGEGEGGKEVGKRASEPPSSSEAHRRLNKPLSFSAFLPGWLSGSGTEIPSRSLALEDLIWQLISISHSTS